MRVTLWRHDVHLIGAPHAAVQRHEMRTRVFVRVEHEGVDGFGEVAPQPTALNGDPGVDEVLDEVLERVVPQLVTAVTREGDLPSWTRMARFGASRPSSNPAVALVEMALLERELRARHLRIESLWPPIFETPRQYGVSLLERGSWHIAEDAVRVRVKTAPDALDDEGVARLRGVRQPVLLDFNCSARREADVFDQIRSLAGVCHVAAVEQPYAPGNVVDTAHLAGLLDVAISVDEGVRSIRDVTQLVRYGAASIVCVKPARVGGLANARTIVATARTMGVGAYVGGFFESPYARAVHRHLAAATTPEPSDVADVVIEDVEPPEVERSDVAFGVRPSAPMLERATVVATVS
jgi:L-alanine-DL-glutamate epimerase-like enolase superfamily enzyme